MIIRLWTYLKNLISTFRDKVKTIKTPNKPFLFDHCIYALQINDGRIFNSHHSHRSIYDIYKLDCKKSLTIENIKKNIYIKHFFLTINKFKIFKIHITSSTMNSYFDKSSKIVRYHLTNVARYFFKKILVNISR